MTAEVRKSRLFPWACGNCGKYEVRPGVIANCETIRYDGNNHEIELPAFEVPQCGACGELLISYDVDRQLNDALRRKVGLLFPEQLRAMREKLNLAREEVATHTGIEVETLRQHEEGLLIQSRAIDRLLRAFFASPDLREALADPARCGELGTTLFFAPSTQAS